MAINTIRRINPLDINKDITLGVSFPLNEKSLSQGTRTTKEQAKTNLVNLLLTEPGERLHLPTYGVGIKKLLFSQVTDSKTLNNAINKQINTYIPQINLIDSISDFSEADYLLYIKIIYSYKIDSTTDAIQLNFNS